MSADHPSEDAAVSAVRKTEDADTFAARVDRDCDVRDDR